MTTLQQKIDFAAILRVKNANPNGDPLNGNRPRTDYDGLGEITDVCLKRKMRDRLLEGGTRFSSSRMIDNMDGEPSLRTRAESEEHGLGKNAFKPNKKDKTSGETTVRAACEKWFDVRSFGQVFAFGKGGDALGVPSLFVVLFQCNLLSVSSLSVLQVLRSQRV